MLQLAFEKWPVWDTSCYLLLEKDLSGLPDVFQVCAESARSVLFLSNIFLWLHVFLQHLVSSVCINCWNKNGNQTVKGVCVLESICGLLGLKTVPPVAGMKLQTVNLIGKQYCKMLFTLFSGKEGFGGPPKSQPLLAEPRYGAAPMPYGGWSTYLCLFLSLWRNLQNGFIKGVGTRALWGVMTYCCATLWLSEVFPFICIHFLLGLYLIHSGL